MQSFISEIRQIIQTARLEAVRSVNHALTMMYWHIGHRIVMEEQHGEERASYGKQLVKLLSEDLQTEFGEGYSSTNLWLMRQFYLTFPILHSLSGELTWTHYKHLIRLEDPDKRAFYINMTHLT